MVFPIDYIWHWRDCRRKQSERNTRITNLPPVYHRPVTETDESILRLPIRELVDRVHSQSSRPIDILRAYGKVALSAHAKTNCLTEILIPSVEGSLEHEAEINLSGPLAGIPVSLKDTIHVRGYDTTVGYSCNAGVPQLDDGTTVKLLKYAGAVPFVKTNAPISLLSFESANDVWGRTSNPHNKRYSPGGSTGGESALLAYGGSRIGIGSDVAGSVRAPAHFSGCYSLRCSVGRWPKGGAGTGMAGQEGVMAVLSPMARTLDDLTYFSRAFIQLEPWKIDHTVIPLPWRDDAAKAVTEQKRLRFGIMRTDGVVDPSPACARALQETVTALEKDGHECFDVAPPSPFEGLRLASLLLMSDGGQTFKSFFRTGEWNDPGAAQMTFYAGLPRFARYLHYLWVRYVRGDVLWARLLRNFGLKTATEQWALVAKRELYRASWLSWWNDQEVTKSGGNEENNKNDADQGSCTSRMDFLLTPPNATPAVPHNGMHDAVSSCGYTFLFNLVDYSCGVLPVAHVDAKQDALPDTFDSKKLNGIAQGAYKHYDAVKMEGLPVGVQVVGRRLEEERVLAGMQRVEDALDKHRAGGRYKLLEGWVE